MGEFNKEIYHIGADLNEHSQRMIASHEWSVNFSPQAEFDRIPCIPVLMRLDPKNAMLMNTSIVAFVNPNSIELNHVFKKRRSTTDQQVDANTSTMIMMIRSIIGFEPTAGELLLMDVSNQARELRTVLESRTVIDRLH